LLRQDLSAEAPRRGCRRPIDTMRCIVERGRQEDRRGEPPRRGQL